MIILLVGHGDSVDFESCAVALPFEIVAFLSATIRCDRKKIHPHPLLYLPNAAFA